MKRNHMLLAAGLVAMLALTGCIFSPDEGDDPPPPDDQNTTTGVVFPDTKDKLMDNFEYIYEHMDFDNFPDLLHEDYKTVLLADTVEDWDLAQPFFTYEDEVGIQQNIFSGNPITDAKGNLQPGISGIQFSLLAQQGTWEETSETHPYFPNAQYAPFDVEFYFHRGSDPSIKVAGLIEFYLVTVPVEVDGVTKNQWKMIGQWDRTNVQN